MVFDFNFSGFAGNAFGPDVRLLNVFLAAWDPRGRLVRWIDALIAVWKAVLRPFVCTASGYVSVRRVRQRADQLGYLKLAQAIGVRICGTLRLFMKKAAGVGPGREVHTAGRKVRFKPYA